MKQATSNTINNSQKKFIISNKYLYLIAIILVISILALLLWPYIAKGKITINSSTENISIEICKESDAQRGMDDTKYTCNNSLVKIELNSTNNSISLPTGNYIFIGSKENYYNDFQKFSVNLWKNTNLNSLLTPKATKISENLYYSTSQNYIDNSTELIKYSSSFDDKYQFKESYILEELNNQTITKIGQIDNFSEIKNINWSPDHSKIIFDGISQENENSQKYYFDITNNFITTSSIPSDNIVWSKNSDKIYYIYQDKKIDFNSTPETNEQAPQGFAPPISIGSNNNTITIANPDGSNWENIYKLDDSYDNPIINISPDNNYLSIITNQKLYLFNFTSKEINNIIENTPVTETIWSPSSQKLLIETINNQLPELQIYNLLDKKVTDLQTQTFIHKTLWINENQIIIAIPNYIPANYVRTNLVTNDTIFITDFDKQPNSENYPYYFENFNQNNPIIIGTHSLSYDNNNQILYYLDQQNYLFELPRTIKS